MYKITFYVPESHLDSVKQALFDAGAGRIGEYDYCAWQCKGSGQYRPLAGSTPSMGQQDQLTAIDEYLVEMVCEKNRIKPVLQALIDAHPYEEPAYGAWPILTLDSL